ncbi:MAG TPA: hypothetical protein PK593_03810, partial [Thermomicrobiales bacterium]|nr:hypothetical protein [Thermomicrobiales bacterium]
GAALSIRSVAGIPIKFIGTGERMDAIEPFYPDRLASRILGMGDMLSLIERAQEQVTEEERQALEEKMLDGQFDLEDFLGQLQSLKKMGPLTQLLEMIPGIGQAVRQQNVEISDDSYKQVEAIIYSMTLQERRHPDIIKPNRRRRIAAGSGTTSEDVNDLLKQFREMQKMMAQMGALAGGGMPGGKKGKRGVMSRMPGQLGQVGQMRDMMKQMEAAGIDPSQLGGMPGMRPGDIDAMMQHGGQLAPLNQRAPSKKAREHAKPPHPQGGKRRKKR